jgi:4-hydroxybenzoate polyprenyltransferase
VLVLLTSNRLTVYLSVVGVFLAASYPYLKRYTYLPQVYLGMAFGWGIPMGFAAVQGDGAAAGLAAVLRQRAVGHRLRHLVRDGRPRGRSQGRGQVHGDPVRRRWTWWRRAFLYASVSCGAGAGRPTARRTWASPTTPPGRVVTLLIAWEFWRARNRDRAGCFRAFLHNNWIGAAVFAGIAAHYVLSR